MSTFPSCMREFIGIEKASSFTDESGDDDESVLECTENDESRRCSAAEIEDIESLAERLFSKDHLTIILQDPIIFEKFKTFLARYMPQHAQSLKRYLDLQKAVAAIKYANTLAENLWPGLEATVMNKSVEARLHAAFDDLTNIALPGYVTYRMTQVVTEIMIMEITGQAIPIIKHLVQGLAEVYCVTDANLPDNPIIYASEEFYRTTQYDQNEVIGKNCRFLQGEKTSRAAVARIFEAIADGQEICEVVLSYRRDGSPFLNLLLIAPLYDAEQNVRHFIGAQIDINGLVQDGAGLESFSHLLARDRSVVQARGHSADTPSSALVELGRTLNGHERQLISEGAPFNQNHARSANTTGRPSRKLIGIYSDKGRDKLWPAQDFGPNGRLPGVFQYYMLVTPYSGLEIVFTSPSLRAASLLNSPFLARVRAPRHIRQSIKSAFAQGQSFTARIAWLPHLESPLATPASECNSTPLSDCTPRPFEESAPANSYFDTPRRQRSWRGELHSKPRWIHCTPLLGANGRCALWMVVMVTSDNIADAVSELSFQQQSPMVTKAR